MKDAPVPTTSQRADTGLIRKMRILAGALSAASIAVNLILQVASHFQKRPVEKDQRDRVSAATLVLKVGRQLPILIKQVRSLAGDLKPKT
jgi:hypothetical protein